MEAILKYELRIKEKQEIELPISAKIIRVDDVDGNFFLWAIANSEKDAETEVRYLEFYKTGQPIETPSKNLKYIGFCKLFIMQELGLYVFENIGK
jgi:hypothetical protein